MSTVYSEDSKWGQTFPSVYSDAQEDPWQTGYHPELLARATCGSALW